MTVRVGMMAVVTGLLIAACGGGTSTDPGTSSSSSGSSGSNCKDSPLAVARACVPPFAKANAPLTLGIDAQGCEGCGQTLKGCKVDVQGKNITLSLDGETCSLPPNSDCAAVCKVAQTTCAIPALAAGNYTVQLVTSTSKQPGVIPAGVRVLVVKDDAQDTTCALTQGPPQPISTDGWPKTCNVASDCVAVLSGDPCAHKCPDAAIAASAQEAYNADYRTRRSQCPPETAVAGGACPEPKVSCTAGQCTFP